MEKEKERQSGLMVYQLSLNDHGEEIMVEKPVADEVKERLWCMTCGQSHFRCGGVCGCVYEKGEAV